MTLASVPDNDNSLYSYLFHVFLPVEIAREIFFYLTPKQLSNVCAVNRTWNRFASQDRLWTAFFPIRKEFLHWISIGRLKKYMISHCIQNMEDMEARTLTFHAHSPGLLPVLYHLIKGYLRTDGTLDEHKEELPDPLRGKFGTKMYLPVAHEISDQKRLSELIFFDLKGTLKENKTLTERNLSVIGIVLAFC